MNNTVEDKEKIDLFLSLFRDLENKLVSIANLDYEDYVSYSRALNHIHSLELDPIIAVDENYSFLKKAGDLRNILSHNNDVCIPADNFLSRFKKIVSLVTKKTDAYTICNKKIIYTKRDMSVVTTMKMMESQSLSHLPILDDQYTVKGVFSRSTIFDYLSINNRIAIDIKNMQIKDFYPVIKIDGHLNESFIFVKKSDDISSLYQMMKKKEKHGKNISLLFVTEHGNENEKLEGIISLADFKVVIEIE
ncbi:MAG: CBS domain-containing protein [Candidatus Enterosoma sp.]|nr:CBS domain-containing protein [Candidatus Enterosoma sp.]